MRHPAFFPARHRRVHGSTLIVAVFIVAILASFIGLAVDYTANTAGAMRRARDLTSAQALANGALEAAYKRWSPYMATRQSRPFSDYTTTAAFSNNITNALTTQLNAAYGTENTNFTLTALVIDPVNRADAVVPAQSLDYATVQPMNNTPGWTAKTWTYRARATVIKTGDPTFSVTVSRYFQQADASLFQAMLFFQNDLELHPGPNMTLYGLVHTNANMYAVAGSGGGLTFSSNVSYAGNRATLNPAVKAPTNFYNNGAGYVEGVTQTLYNQESNNWNAYKNPVYANSMGSQLSNVSALDPLGMSETAAVDSTNGNASGTHEIIERPVPTSKTDPNASPSVTDPEAFAAHRIFNSAGVRIIINRNDKAQPVRVYYPDPSDPEKSLPAQNPVQQGVADGIVSAITVDNKGTIYDFREGRAINADTVDVSKLTPVLNGYNAYNGVVYITDATNADASGNTGNSDAIRLKKGGVLPDAGMTIATDGAVYVQGDYNTGTTYGPDGANNAVLPIKQPVSNANLDPTKYTVDGYTQKPAAVMGDAVMILSNAWSDVGSSSSLGSRNATPTTMNSAIVSGQVLTNSVDPITGQPNGKASGGAHNFPRFLEDWSGDNFTYHGSMCQLYASTHFTGAYGKANVYGAPNRRWFFDDNFLSTPPPGNLRSTSYTRGRWVRESKDLSL